MYKFIYFDVFTSYVLSKKIFQHKHFRLNDVHNTYEYNQTKKYNIYI